MKAVIIGASREALHTIRKARAHGIFITALDGDPQAAGLAAADRGVVVDISREEETIEAVRKEGPDFVLTAPIGRYLTTVGAVNDALGLPGITRRMAELCTDKFLFHEKLAREGLRNCRCYRVRQDGAVLFDGADREEVTGEDLCSERLQMSWPVILKPRFGSGSRGIRLAGCLTELKEELERIRGEEYVLEECVPGEEYGIDGAVIGGKFYMVLLRCKVNTPLPARQAVGYFACGRKDGFWQQASGHLEKVIGCLGLQECLFHADVIRAADGPFVIELSARPSGHNLHNLFTPLCTGVDPAEEYIRYRAGESYSFVSGTVRPLMIHYFDGEGRVYRAPDDKQAKALLQGFCEKRDAQLAMLRWQCNLSCGELLGPVTDGHSLMGRGYYILEGGRRQDMLAFSEELMNEILRHQ